MLVLILGVSCNPDTGASTPTQRALQPPTPYVRLRHSPHSQNPATSSSTTTATSSSLTSSSPPSSTRSVALPASLLRCQGGLLSFRILFCGPSTVQAGARTILRGLDCTLWADFTSAGCRDAESQSACGGLGAEAVVVAVRGEDAHLVVDVIVLVE